MSKDEKELLEKFRKLTPENRANALSNIHVAYASQENTKKSMGAKQGIPERGRKSA